MAYKKTEEEEKPKTSLEKFLEKAKLKEEIAEVADETYEETGYPEPAKNYRLILESFGTPVEQIYFWIYNHLRYDQNYNNIIKLVDTFSASESSTFWGQNTQRLNFQQEKAGGYLRIISELIKQLFQIVRELRMIDEKITVRKAWSGKNKEGKRYKSADVTLKGEFVELVEGGAKEVNSVYGLAREVGFHILPDLFFNTRIYRKEDVDRIIGGMEYNEKVKAVLKKKLFNFLVWLESTDKEFNDRRTFQLRYLYQHWQTIRTYMMWIKPYLRNIKRLSMKQKHIDSAEIIGAFETSIIEIEILAHKSVGKGVNACTLAHFYYTTKPNMSFHTQDYQNKGPIHVGKVIIDLKAYGWSDDQIKEYQEYRDEEDLELLGLADQKIQAAMDMLGDSFKEYLKECGEEFVKKKEEKPKKQKQDSILTPFLAIFSGFAELGKAFFPPKEKVEKEKKVPDKKALEKAAKAARMSTWLTYNLYKKANGLLAW